MLNKYYKQELVKPLHVIMCCCKKMTNTIIEIPMEFVGDNPARLRMYVSDKKNKQKNKKINLYMTTAII